MKASELTAEQHAAMIGAVVKAALATTAPAAVSANDPWAALAARFAPQDSLKLSPTIVGDEPGLIFKNGKGEVPLSATALAYVVAALKSKDGQAAIDKILALVPAPTIRSVIVG